MQVLICAYGEEGLRRVAEGSHPQVEGVEYVVSWQKGGAGMEAIPHELWRKDIRIYPTDTKGLSANRNHSLECATAPLLLIGDDDVDYTEEGLKKVMRAFDHHPEFDILTFRYRSDTNPRWYPECEISLHRRPKGYYVCSIEIAFRRDSVKGKIRFNEHFGIGATFPAGEEDVFIADCLDAGLHAMYIPTEIERHEGATTSDRQMMSASRPMTKGALLLRLHPHTWPLRMMVHAMREVPMWRRGEVPSPVSFVKNWLRGVRTARDLKVYETK